MKVPLTLVEEKADLTRAGRSCGGCTACCVLPRIIPEPDFPQGKAGFTPCKDLCENGCGIYDNRPELCRIYECLWRSGILEGDERRRPDNLGLMLRFEPYEDGGIIEAWELWDDAAYNHPGRGVIDAIAKHYLVAIRFYGVPASLGYYGPEYIELGRRLSKLSREDPRALAGWCRQNVITGRLECPEIQSAMVDLEVLERGEPITRHYHRR